MAQEFVRNIKHTDATKEPLYTTQQNDLISDEKDVFIHNNGKYEKITGNDTSSDVASLKSDNTKNKNDIKTLQTDNSKNKDNISKLQSDLTDLTNRLAALEKPAE